MIFTYVRFKEHELHDPSFEIPPVPCFEDVALRLLRNVEPRAERISWTDSRDPIVVSHDGNQIGTLVRRH